MDCFTCDRPDCNVDGVTQGEMWEQDQRDNRIILDQVSEKVKKRREYQRKYNRSEKGKANNRRKTQKRIASGKNAEYCRAYYYRKKAKGEQI